MSYVPIMLNDTGLLIAQRLQEVTAELALKNAREECPLFDISVKVTEKTYDDTGALTNVKFATVTSLENIIAAHGAGRGLRLVVDDTTDNATYYYLPKKVSHSIASTVEFWSFDFVNNSSLNAYGKPSQITVACYPKLETPTVIVSSVAL